MTFYVQLSRALQSTSYYQYFCCVSQITMVRFDCRLSKIDWVVSCYRSCSGVMIHFQAFSFSTLVRLRIHMLPQSSRSRCSDLIFWQLVVETCRKWLTQPKFENNSTLTPRKSRFPISYQCQSQAFSKGYHATSKTTKFPLLSYWCSRCIWVPFYASVIDFWPARSMLSLSASKVAKAYTTVDLHLMMKVFETSCDN